MNNNKLVFITIVVVAAAMILATVVPTQVSADRSSGQQGISKAREASGNTRSCPGLNEASSHTSGGLTPCPLLP
jgi:hypothetical protein